MGNNISPKEHFIISCQNPFIALAIIQEFFPAGERQVFTPFSFELSEYQVSPSLKYAIVVGEDNELFNIIEKINNYNKNKVEENNIKIIQIKSKDFNQLNDAITLDIKVHELESLKKDYHCLEILNNETSICLTDLLLLAMTPLSNGLSFNEISNYVPQRLSDEKVILPYDKLKSLIKELEKNSNITNKTWIYEKDECNNEKLVCKIKVILPECLHGKCIHEANNKNFILNEKQNNIFYVFDEKNYLAPVKDQTSK